MRNSRDIQKFLDMAADEDQCPECGHLWADDGPVHYTDCRYFTVDEAEEKEDEVTRQDLSPEISVGVNDRISQ